MHRESLFRLDLPPPQAEQAGGVGRCGQQHGDHRGNQQDTNGFYGIPFHRRLLSAFKKAFGRRKMLIVNLFQRFQYIVSVHSSPSVSSVLRSRPRRRNRMLFVLLSLYPQRAAMVFTG